ncbi:hypothetical protein, partial [Klebsiella pneumoniae]|uniref:hypothetical protein n=1 Tax=Klebsiella pneumoniae TaxID=573 RepID=UPI003013B30B
WVTEPLMRPGGAGLAAALGTASIVAAQPAFFRREIVIAFSGTGVDVLRWAGVKSEKTGEGAMRILQSNTLATTLVATVGVTLAMGAAGAQA